MSGHSFGPAEIERSVGFFMDPGNYRAFELDSAQRHIVGCIDPRDQHSNRLPTVLQTAGGAIGEGLDGMIAHTAVDGEAVTLFQALDRDKESRPDVKLCAHEVCRFVGGIIPVTDEMINPTDFTDDSFNRWIRHYDLSESISSRTERTVRDTVERDRDTIPNESALLAHVDNLYPGSTSVAKMKGENRAGIYVVNHHPNVGLDRHRKHRVHKPPVQAYHDSLGATVGNLKAMHADTEFLKFRLAAHILRSAAVRTVIGGGNPNTVYLEAGISETGIKIEELAA